MEMTKGKKYNAGWRWVVWGSLRVTRPTSGPVRQRRFVVSWLVQAANKSGGSVFSLTVLSKTQVGKQVCRLALSPTAAQSLLPEY